MKVDIAVFDGMDELDAIEPLEVLRRADFDVQLVTLSSTPSIRCANGLQIIPDGLPRNDAEIVIFPGGGWAARNVEGVRAQVGGARWEPVIDAAAKRGAILASVCTGAMILASAGALNGRRATTHHSALGDLAASGAIVTYERVVDDGNLITAGGVTSGIDLGLWLVQRFASRERAEQIAADLEYPRERSAC